MASGQSIDYVQDVFGTERCFFFFWMGGDVKKKNSVMTVQIATHTLSFQDKSWCHELVALSDNEHIYGPASASKTCPTS